MDASKAPGYRGTTVCSPVSSKTSSNSTTPPSLPLPPGTSFQGASVFSPAQCVPHTSGTVITMAVKQPPPQAAHSGLAVARPVSNSNTLDMHSNLGASGTSLSVGIVGQQPSSHMDVTSGPVTPSPFGNRAVFQGELPPRTVASQQHGIIVSSSQSTLDHGALYTPVSTPGYGPDPQSHNATLLKMVPGVGDPQPVPQQQQQHPMLSSYHHQHSHHHPLNYSQPKPNLGVSSSQVNANTTVSMSRLNPSAPDFSLHLSNKPQQQPPPPPPPPQQPQQQPPPPPPPQQGGNMFSATATFHQRANVLPPSSLQTSPSALGTMLPNVSFPLAKSSLSPYHHQPLPGPGPASGPPTANAQRWPLFQAAYPHHPHPDVMGQISFSGNMAQLASLAASLAHPGNSGAAADILAGLENGALVGGGNSPAMSPSSPASANPGAVSEPNHHKLEDRKIPPRPIGTERASWKNNYGNMGGAGASPELDPNWMLGCEPKMPISSWVGTGMSRTMERQQLYRASASHYNRLTLAEEMPHMMDANFQVCIISIHSSTL